MNENIDRNSIIIQSIEEYKLIVDTEIHHNHEIIKDKNGILRWKENKTVSFLFDNNMLDLNNIIINMYNKGYNKNSEEYRQLHRDLGYSLSGYWEIFYWEVNNEY